jgi:hypothetical protein
VSSWELFTIGWGIVGELHIKLRRWSDGDVIPVWGILREVSIELRRCSGGLMGWSKKVMGISHHKGWHCIGVDS